MEKQQYPFNAVNPCVKTHLSSSCSSSSSSSLWLEFLSEVSEDKPEKSWTDQHGCSSKQTRIQGLIDKKNIKDLLKQNNKVHG